MPSQAHTHNQLVRTMAHVSLNETNDYYSGTDQPSHANHQKLLLLVPTTTIEVGRFYSTARQPLRMMQRRVPPSSWLFLTSVRECVNPGTVTRIFFGSVGALYRPTLLDAGSDRLATTGFDSGSPLATLPPKSSRRVLERSRPPSPLG